MLRIILIVIAVFLLFAVIVIIHDMTCFKVVHYTLTQKKLEKDVRFVLMADLHDHMFRDSQEKLIKAVEDADPDGILIAGDLVTDVYSKRFSGAIKLLEGLAGKYPIYYAPGNHETKLDTRRAVFKDTFDLFLKELDRMGLRLMRNESIYLKDQNIMIHALELPLHCFSHFNHATCLVEEIEKAVGKPDKEQVNILIAHNPEHCKTYLDWGSDLVVSGHQHGGIVRLPFVGGLIATSGVLFPKYDGGLFTEDKGNMIISRGLGTHTIPVRFYNPCELVVIDLKRGCE